MLANFDMVNPKPQTPNLLCQVTTSEFDGDLNPKPQTTNLLCQVTTSEFDGKFERSGFKLSWNGQGDMPKVLQWEFRAKTVNPKP
jgi:hypothetical protein